MAVSLTKGGNVSLTKQAAQSGNSNLTGVTVGLGWDARTTTGVDFDLDSSAIVVGENGQVLSEKHFVYFNNLTAPNDVVVHSGDNLTGAGDGDDEKINVNLAALPVEAARVVFPVAIYDAEGRQQNFGQVRNAFIRVVDQAGTELVRYDLSEDYSTETAVIFGEVYRSGGDWKFKAVGQGYANGLAGIARDYGVQV